jgi:alanine transaminase
MKKNILLLNKLLNLKNINPYVLNAQYAVRGKVVIQADKINQLLKSKPKDHGLPFNEIVFCNIGNPQQLEQKPITFNRNVLIFD